MKNIKGIVLLVLILASIYPLTITGIRRYYNAAWKQDVSSGDFYFDKGDNRNAIFYFESALKVAPMLRKSRDTSDDYVCEKLSTAYHNIGAEKTSREVLLWHP